MSKKKQKKKSTKKTKIYPKQEINNQTINDNKSNLKTIIIENANKSRYIAVLILGSLKSLFSILNF